MRLESTPGDVADTRHSVFFWAADNPIHSPEDPLLSKVFAVIPA